MRTGPPLQRLAVIAALSVMLAGCTGGPQAEPDAAIEDPCLVTQPGDYSCSNPGSNETAPGSAEHLHDYWGGQQNITVTQQTDAVGTVTQGQVTVRFRPQQDEVIPQGTARVEMVWNWTDGTGNLYSSVRASVRTAAAAEWIDLGDVESGVAVEQVTTNLDDDLPHQRLSAWEFRLDLGGGPAGATVYSGLVTLEVVAWRGLEIPLYPGHPDRWDGQEGLELLDERIEVSASELGGPTICASTCLETHRPVESVVPHDAAAVRVHLTVMSPIDATLGLEYHGSDSWEFLVTEPDRLEADTRIFEIPVVGTGDGPYASTSLWELRPFIDGPVQDGVFSGEYRIQAWALRSLSI